MVMTVTNLGNGQQVELPANRVRGGEWYEAAIERGLRDARGLQTQRSKQPLRGVTILKVMKVYVDLARGGFNLSLGQKALGEKAGVAESTARRAQQWLVENGWLLVTDRFETKTRGGPSCL